MCSALWTILSPSMAVLYKHCNDDFNYVTLCWMGHTNVTLWGMMPHYGDFILKVSESS